jgi:hypothetical protein
LLFVDELEMFLFDWCVIFRWEEGIHYDLHHLIDHLGEKFLDELVGNPEVRVVVDLQDPGPEVFVYEEVVSEELKLFLLSTSVEKFLYHLGLTLALISVSITNSFIFEIMLASISSPLPSASGRVARYAERVSLVGSVLPC